MRIHFPSVLLGCGLFLWSLPDDAAVPSASATPPPEPPHLPGETVLKATADVRPSTRLQPFLDTNLEKILAPLGEPAFSQSSILTNMQAGYADAQATAPDPYKAAFQAAQLVCDALANAIAERQTAVSALHGSLTTRSSEASQPKGGAFERGASTALGDAFFTTSQQNVWNARAAVLRQNITAA